MPSRAKQEAPSLTQIFALSDTVEYAGLKITKPIGRSWEHARAFINNVEVEITEPKKKQILALLISQEGQPLTKEDAEANLIYDGKNDPAKVYKTHISQIKADIIATHPELKPFLDQITSAKYTRHPEIRAAYKNGQLRGAYLIEDHGLQTPPTGDEDDFVETVRYEAEENHIT